MSEEKPQSTINLDDEKASNQTSVVENVNLGDRTNISEDSTSKDSLDSSRRQKLISPPEFSDDNTGQSQFWKSKLQEYQAFSVDRDTTEEQKVPKRPFAVISKVSSSSKHSSSDEESEPSKKMFKSQSKVSNMSPEGPTKAAKPATAVDFSKSKIPCDISETPVATSNDTSLFIVNDPNLLNRYTEPPQRPWRFSKEVRVRLLKEFIVMLTTVKLQLADLKNSVFGNVGVLPYVPFENIDLRQEQVLVSTEQSGAQSGVVIPSSSQIAETQMSTTSLDRELKNLAGLPTQEELYEGFAELAKREQLPVSKLPVVQDLFSLNLKTRDTLIRLIDTTTQIIKFLREVDVEENWSEIRDYMISVSEMSYRTNEMYRECLKLMDNCKGSDFWAGLTFVSNVNFDLLEAYSKILRTLTTLNYEFSTLYPEKLKDNL